MGTEQSLVLYKIVYLHENAKLHHTYLSLADCTRQDTVFNVPSVHYLNQAPPNCVEGMASAGRRGAWGILCFSRQIFCIFHK